ncbi:nucleoside hydrolase [Nocardia sp. NPDC051570]|uniref:nucleoside hydrolase n=1 Tax=Nocardia sp. NPDC051570 TaxID=3364324 RepID=UPI0037B937DD
MEVEACRGYVEEMHPGKETLMVGDEPAISQVEFVRGISMDRMPGVARTWPEPSAMPLILDTDVGFEPDDALALVLAARLPSLALIITSDEFDNNRRARLARFMLRVLNSRDIPIVGGASLGNENHWTLEDLVPDYIPTQPTDIVSAIRQVLDEHKGLIGWVGLGPMSNLALALAEIPELRDRLVVTQQEGTFPALLDSAEQNIALDLPSARAVLDSGIRPWIVPVDISYPFNAITKESIEYEIIDRAADPICTLLRLNFDLWLSERPAAHLPGVLTLTQAIGMPFVTAISADVGLDEFGRICAGSNPVYVGQDADEVKFHRWLVDQMKEIHSSSIRHPASRRLD